MGLQDDGLGTQPDGADFLELPALRQALPHHHPPCRTSSLAVARRTASCAASRTWKRRSRRWRRTRASPWACRMSNNTPGRNCSTSTPAPSAGAASPTARPTKPTNRSRSSASTPGESKKDLFARAPYLLGQKKGPDGKPLTYDGPPTCGGAISAETIWACTLCRDCEERCPVNIEQVPRIVELRRRLVMIEGEMPNEPEQRLPRPGTQQQPLGLGRR